MNAQGDGKLPSVVFVLIALVALTAVAIGVFRAGGQPTSPGFDDVARRTPRTNP